MSAVITIASSKGGCGKTTLAMTLGMALRAEGRTVAWIDADPNGTLSDWHGSNYEGPNIECIAETDHVAIVDKATELAKKNSVVVIDTAGFSNMAAAYAMMASDCVLIPCMADRGSVREAYRTVQTVSGAAKAARRPIPYRIVLSHWFARGLAESAARDDLKNWNVQYLESVIPPIASVKQLTFTGAMAGGRVKEIAENLAAELATLKFIPQKRAVKK